MGKLDVDGDVAIARYSDFIFISVLFVGAFFFFGNYLAARKSSNQSKKKNI